MDSATTGGLESSFAGYHFQIGSRQLASIKGLGKNLKRIK
jgi:hypothetical protein